MHNMHNGIKLFIMSMLILSAAIVYSATAAAPSTEKQSQFFAGLFLLQSRTDLSMEVKIKMFHTLNLLTGISAAEAVVLLERYRGKPAEWQKLYDAVSTTISRAQTAVKTDKEIPETPLTTQIKRK
jgi:hypothetical protein